MVIEMYVTLRGCCWCTVSGHRPWAHKFATVEENVDFRGFCDRSRSRPSSMPQRHCMRQAGRHRPVRCCQECLASLQLPALVSDRVRKPADEFAVQSVVSLIGRSILQQVYRVGMLCWMLWSDCAIRQLGWNGVNDGDRSAGPNSRVPARELSCRRRKTLRESIIMAKFELNVVDAVQSHVASPDVLKATLRRDCDVYTYLAAANSSLTHVLT